MTKKTTKKLSFKKAVRKSLHQARQTADLCKEARENIPYSIRVKSLKTKKVPEERGKDGLEGFTAPGGGGGGGGTQTREVCATIEEIDRSKLEKRTIGL